MFERDNLMLLLADNLINTSTWSLAYPLEVLLSDTLSWWCSESLRTFQLTCFFALFSSMSVKATEIRRKIFLSWSAKAEDGKLEAKTQVWLLLFCAMTFHRVYCFSCFYALEFSAVFLFFREAIVGRRENDKHFVYTKNLSLNYIERVYLWKHEWNQPQHLSNVSFADFQFAATFNYTAKSTLQQWKRFSNKWESKWIGLVVAGSEQCTLWKRNWKETWVWQAVSGFNLI